MTKNSKKIWLVIAIVVVVLIIIVAWPSKKVEEPLAPEVPEEEVVPEAEVEEVVDIKELPKAPEPKVKKFKIPTPIVEGASPVTAEGEVLAPSGEVAKSEALPSSPEAPSPSRLLEQEEVEELEEQEQGLVINVSLENGFQPNQFVVQPGQVVNIILTAVDDDPHSIRFTIPELTGVAASVNGGQSRAITFKAPDTPGEYPFHCTSPGHKRKGESGKMIVVE